MITRVHVKNFRSFKDLDIRFGRLNAVIGPNMSGKSNLIDFFRFVIDLLITPRGMGDIQNAFNKRLGFAEVIWKGDALSQISFEIEGTGYHQREEVQWNYELSLSGNLQWGNVGVDFENLLVTANNVTHALITTEQGGRHLKYFDGRAISTISDRNQIALQYSIPDWEADLIRNALSSCRFYNLIPPLMRQLNPASAPNFLTEYGDNLSSWLLVLQTRYQQSFQRLQEVARDVFPEIEDLFTWPTTQSTVYLASREKFLKLPVSLAQMSDGELKFIALLSLIVAPVELGAMLSCVEEPENHLHPRLLEVLFRVLRQIQEELPPEERGQVIITTHSPHVIDKFRLDEILVFFKREGATQCMRPADKAALREALQSDSVSLGDLYYSGVLFDA